MVSQNSSGCSIILKTGDDPIDRESEMGFGILIYALFTKGILIFVVDFLDYIYFNSYLIEPFTDSLLFFDILFYG